MGLAMQERRALTREVAVRYRKSNKAGKKRILDEFTQTTGYHRKYAITLLTHEGKRRLVRVGSRTFQAEIRHKSRPGNYPKIYGEAVRKALTRLWEQFNCQCSKLLAPFLNANIDVIAAGDPMDETVREQLRHISASTVERLLARHKRRLKIRGTSGTRSGPPLKKRVTILSHFECAQQPPGFFQIDLVQHDGGNPSGEFCYTLIMTDAASGWTGPYPIR
jgi:hypothetical protein